MTLADLELAFVIARVAYQTEVDEGEPYLVDPDNATFEILPPGTWDSKSEERAEAWTIIMGEEGDRGIMRAEGATLAEAAAEFRRVVRLRHRAQQHLRPRDGPGRHRPRRGVVGVAQPIRNPVPQPPGLRAGLFFAHPSKGVRDVQRQRPRRPR